MIAVIFIEIDQIINSHVHSAVTILVSLGLFDSFNRLGYHIQFYRFSLLQFFYQTISFAQITILSINKLNHFSSPISTDED